MICEAVGYFFPKKDASGFIQVRVLGNDKKKAIPSVSESSVSDGKFYLLDDSSDNDLSSDYSVVMYNNEYYLATYDKDEKNLLINSWTLCDEEYDAIVNNHIGTSYSKYILW